MSRCRGCTCAEDYAAIGPEDEGGTRCRSSYPAGARELNALRLKCSSANLASKPIRGPSKAACGDDASAEGSRHAAPGRRARLAPVDFLTASVRGEPSHGELWVFGYGSLMWRPGFPYSIRCKAMLSGWRRSLCVYSHVYRGTPDRPGLVLGLDRGGACHGVAFRVEAALREPTIRYLREREQATAVYIERMVPITLESGERVNALTFVADRMHPQYAGRLTREAMLELVRTGTGKLGDNAAYVTETYNHLLAIGVRDRDLEWLSARLRSGAY